MSQKIRLLFGCALLALAVTGCGKDKKDPSPADGGDEDAATGVNYCPVAAPDRDELDPSCCFRASNAERQGAPTFRLTSLQISQPATLDSVLLTPVIEGALGNETFNWLLEVSGADADGAVDVRMGIGSRKADSTFEFANGNAKTPGDVNRWNPAEFAGTLTGETFSGGSDASLTIPMGNPKNPILELPLQTMNIVKAKMSESRSCIGSVTADGFDGADGELTTFITVEGAAAISFKVAGTPLNLCNIIADITEGTDPCTDVPRADWNLLPDSLCDEAGCSVGDCDGATTCNAWQLKAKFSAAGVDIGATEGADAGADAGADGG